MPMEFRITLAEDRQSVAIEASVGTVNAAQMEELIATLISIRADMEPRRASIDPFPGVRVITSPAARWYMDGRPDGLVLLGIMHPGLGWVGVPLDLEGAASLAAQAVKSAAAAMEKLTQAQTHRPQSDPNED